MASKTPSNAKPPAVHLAQGRGIQTCRDRYQCKKCKSYFSHLIDAIKWGGTDRGEDEDDPMDSSSENGSEPKAKGQRRDDENNFHDDAEESEDEDEEKSPDQLAMANLLQLQDLRGKSRTFGWLNEETATHQESGAYAAMAAMCEETANKLEVAQAQVTELNVRMAEMSVKLEEKDRCMAEMGIKLEEKDGKIHDLQNRMDAFVIQRDTERDTERDDLLTALAASREEARMLREEEFDMQRPRKQVKSGLTPLHAGPSTAPLGKLPLLMKRPAPSDSPYDIAQYLQHNEETEFKGIPLSMPGFVVDMRDVRGYRQVFSRLPTYQKEALDEKFHVSRCLLRLLLVLAVPGRYTELLAQQHVVIAPTAALTACDWGQQPLALTDGEVCVLLAASGLTAAVAHDSWQFCYHYLQASAARPDIYVTSALLELWDRIKDATPPPGLDSADADRYPRNVPGKRKEHRKNWKH
ncbi:hypothetical protein B0H14DRAFT_3471491 [Mycena olivaceomarginata]|nr:hypothetical protein B0H14DRAFT_3471491 [Mycena olivaceomarginata]